MYAAKGRKGRKQVLVYCRMQSLWRLYSYSSSFLRGTSVLLCVNQTCQQSSCRHVNVQLSNYCCRAVSVHSRQCESIVLMFRQACGCFYQIAVCVWTVVSRQLLQRNKDAAWLALATQEPLQVITLFHARFYHICSQSLAEGGREEGAVQGAPFIRVYRNICELAIRLDGCVG